MNKLIAVISQKGGVGKSTVTVLLANIFYFVFNLKVAIIDADYPQNSIAKRRRKELNISQTNNYLKPLYDKLYADKDPYPIIPTNLPSALVMIDKLEEDFDFIFLDVTGTLNQPGFKEVLLQVNHFLIPVLQDEFSVISAVEFYRMLHKNILPVSEASESCQLFFNRVPRKHNVPNLLGQLAPHFDFLPSYLCSYAVYERRYRSTLFPIPRAKKEAVKLIDFCMQLQSSLQMEKLITQ
ncbi:MAG: ParA family protein [Saprospiraceae bacterium]